MTGGLVWIASYPRSGSTWFRALLTNLLAAGSEPASIDRLAGVTAADREWADSLAGVESSRLTPGETDRLRAAVHRAWAEACGRHRYLKVHDAFRQCPDGRALFPPEITDRAVYLVRNPLDVAVSFARLTGRPIADAVRMLNGGRDPCGPARRGVARQFDQALGSWSAHAAGWVDHGQFPVLTVRYEDLAAEPDRAVARAAAFLGLEVGGEAVGRAVAFSRFEELRRQESAGGFRERPAVAATFFRKGTPGQWREALAAGHVRSLVEAHGAMMRRWGYLGEDGSPLGG